MIMRTYAVKYELAAQPVDREHRTLKAAIRDWRSCRAAADEGGDEQAITVVVYEKGTRVNATRDEVIAMDLAGVDCQP
jgi:hypothetical protein